MGGSRGGRGRSNGLVAVSEVLRRSDQIPDPLFLPVIDCLVSTAIRQRLTLFRACGQRTKNAPIPSSRGSAPPPCDPRRAPILASALCYRLQVHTVLVDWKLCGPGGARPGSGRRFRVCCAARVELPLDREKARGRSVAALLPAQMMAETLGKVRSESRSRDGAIWKGARVLSARSWHLEQERTVPAAVAELDDEPRCFSVCSSERRRSERCDVEKSVDVRRRRRGSSGRRIRSRGRLAICTVCRHPYRVTVAFAALLRACVMDAEVIEPCPKILR